MEFLNDDIVSDFADFKTKINNEVNQMSFLHTEEPFTFYKLVFTPQPRVKSVIMINEDLTCKIYVDEKEVPQSKFRAFLTQNKISFITQFLNLLSFVDTIECEHIDNFFEREISSSDNEQYKKSLLFFKEQIKLLSLPDNRRRYSPDILVLSYLIYAVSLAAYKTIIDQKILSFPSTRRLKQLSSSFEAQPGKVDEAYLQTRVSQLNAFESHCLLIIDEIYVSKTVQMSAGKLIGVAEDESSPASTILTFMVKSFCGKFKDVVFLYPISKISGDKILNIF